MVSLHVDSQGGIPVRVIPRSCACRPADGWHNSAMTDIKVSGMTCGHCVKAVTTELEAISGVSGVTVSLNTDGPSGVAFAAEDSVTPEQIAAAIDEAGYELA